MKGATRYFLILSLIVTCGLGFLFPHHNPHFIWQKFPVFDAMFGFVGCVVIILVSKWIGKKLLVKDEGYYD